MKNLLSEGVDISGEIEEPYKKLLTHEALSFLAKLHRKFNYRRLELLKMRERRQQALDKGELPRFPAQTAALRADPSWHVATTPKDLEKRWVEITGPTDRKMLINALNSGADIFMADFEDSNSPTWKNMVEGQLNLIEAIAGTISFTSKEGKHYQLNEKRATLMVRPRGWHLNEDHCQVDGEAMSGSLFDFGLYFFHNGKTLIRQGTGPYFYLPKIENHLEARLWNEVFTFAQKELSIPHGTIRATVLLETILAAFEMEEILYELRDHSAGLNAGRWDYLFSIIKKFHGQSGFIFPDRVELTMTIPFMRAYTTLLVQSCHKRGAHAIGGMAAFIPSRKDPEVNKVALAKVREDKQRESSDGFDGTWVAHPDLVPVAYEVFAKALQDKPNQKQRPLPTEKITEEQLLNFAIAGGKITEEGVRKNIAVALCYLDSWLSGIGAAAIFNLMEDVATAEIARAQLWQWVHHGAVLDDGRQITEKLYQQLAQEEVDKLEKLGLKKVKRARELLDKLVLPEQFQQFLTLQAYRELH
jgi:malate synthase